MTSSVKLRMLQRVLNPTCGSVLASYASRNEEGEKVTGCGPVTEVLLYLEILLSLHSYKKKVLVLQVMC